MHFTCSRETLHTALTALSSVIPTQSVKPVLQNIRFDMTGEETIELSATDYDVGVRYEIDVQELSDPVSFILPAAKLNSATRENLGDTVTFDVNDYKADLALGSAKYHIIGEPGEDFPEIGSLDEDAAMEIRAEDLATAIHRTLFATARDETRYTLAGVSVHAEEKRIEFAATDTHRLALSKKKLRAAVEAPQTAIVLSKGMAELERLLEGEELVKLQITDTLFLAKTSRATLVSHLIEGQFPRYNDVIPKDLDKKVTMKREDFLRGLRASSGFLNEQTRLVRFSASAEELVMQSIAQDVAEAKISIPASLDGAEVTVCFNHAFISDVVRILPDEEITLQLRDSASPAKIESGDYTYVAMPIAPKDQ